jgi:hypothetical protein
MIKEGWIVDLLLSLDVLKRLSKNARECLTRKPCSVSSFQL